MCVCMLYAVFMLYGDMRTLISMYRYMCIFRFTTFCNICILQKQSSLRLWRGGWRATEVALSCLLSAGSALLSAGWSTSAYCTALKASALLGSALVVSDFKLESISTLTDSIISPLPDRDSADPGSSQRKT